jgi:membrane-associated protein
VTGVTAIEHMNGPVLLGVICLLIFVEESGIPVPFAPGDLLLVVSGLAIRGGSIHPALGLAAVYLATIVGAMLGRELFDVVGARILRRLTGSTRLAGPLARAARLLERGGWPAVMVGRLTPGLRIHTTEVAGLLGLSRRTFLFGLAPAAGIYVGVFTGAGILFGRPAIAMIERLVDRLGLGVTLLMAVLVSAGVIWVGIRVLREPGTVGADVSPAERRETPHR